MADNSNIDEFVIAVRLETDKLQQDFSKLSGNIKKSADEIKDKFDSTFSPDRLNRNLVKNTDLIKTATLNIAKILTGGLGTLGGILGTKFGIDFIKNMTSQAHGTELISKAFDTSPKQIQLLQEVYKRFGGTAENATGDIAQFASRLRSGQQDPALMSVLHELGIKTNKGTKDPVATILEILQKIGTGGYTPVQRSSLIQRAGFGAEGLAAVNDPNSFQKYIQKVQKDLLDNTDTAQLAELDRRFQDIGERWRKIQTTLLADIVPAIEVMTTLIEKLLHPIDSFKENNQRRKTLINKELNHTETREQQIKQFQTGENYTPKNLWNDVKKFITPNQKKPITQIQPKVEKIDFESADEMVPPIIIAPDNFKQRKKSTAGQIRPIFRKYNDNQNIIQNQMHLDKIKQGGFSMNNSIPTKHTAINHHNQTSYNMDNVHLHGVNNPRQFVREIDMLRNTAFASGRNQIA